MTTSPGRRVQRGRATSATRSRSACGFLESSWACTTTSATGCSWSLDGNGDQVSVPTTINISFGVDADDVVGLQPSGGTYATTVIATVPGADWVGIAFDHRNHLFALESDAQIQAISKTNASETLEGSVGRPGATGVRLAHDATDSGQLIAYTSRGALIELAAALEAAARRPRLAPADRRQREAGGGSAGHR
jgi:hypothetical protein